MAWRVNGQVVIGYDHWVHVVLFGQEVERKDVILRSLHRIAEAGKGNFDQAHEILSPRTDAIPDFQHESELFKLVDDIWGHEDWELRSVVEMRLTFAVHGRTGEFLKRRERLVAHIEAPLGEIEVDRLLLAFPPLFTR